jgi:hypothetical protein
LILLFGIGELLEARGYGAGRVTYRWFANLTILVAIYLSLVPLFYGVSAGRADRREGAYHLLANSGVSANAHWVAKHVVWLSLALVTALWFLTCEWLLASFPTIATVQQPLWKAARAVAVETFSGSSMGPPFGNSLYAPNFGEVMAVVLFVVVLLYTLGHLLSSIIPSAMTALVVGLISIAVLTFTWGALTELEVPFSLTIGLFPLIFLLTGWLRIRDWLVDRNSLAAWGRVAVSLCVPLFGICCGISIFRVVQISAATLPLELQSPKQQTDEAPSLKQSLFVDAVKALTGPTPRSTDDPPQTVADGWEFADAATRDWVAANEPARKLALEAARQERGNFPDFTWPARERGSLTGEGVITLARLLLDSARKLESEDKLEVAFENYLAIARLGDDLKRSHAWRSGWRIPLRGMALDAMDRWAAHPKQTPELIRRAISRFQQFEEGAPSEASALFNDWRIEREWFRDYVWKGNNTNLETRSPAETGFVRWCLPWELLRLQRLQNVLFSTSLDAVQLVERQLRDRQFVDADLVAFEHWRAPWKWERTTLPPPFDSPSGSDWMAIPASRVSQAALARMHFLAWAAVDYHREHHKLPATLAELVPTYFSTVPIDPWTGESFLWDPNGVGVRLSFQALQLGVNQPFIASGGSLGCRLVFSSIPGDRFPPIRVMTRSGRDNNAGRSEVQPLDFPAPALAIPSLTRPPKKVTK